jgi:TolB protein
MRKIIFTLVLVATSFQLFAQAQSTQLPKESKYLQNIMQLTFGGDNAEAYFSPDGKRLVFQSNNPEWGLECDQIFYMLIEDAAQNQKYKPLRISTGEGRTTCSYYMPNGKHMLYASTHQAGKSCPHTPPPSGKYLWPIYDSYDIFIADEKGKTINQLTNTPGYDAEATVSPKGDKIVFTSTRNGDLDLYVMDIDGKNVKQLTFDLGYDGGAFFSPDGTKILFRASRPKGQDSVEYVELLKQGLVAPTNMEIFIINLDGTGLRQVTNLGKANWAPFYHPSGKKILFSSNHHSQRGYDFQIYMINEDGTGLEQITTESMFNAFPMFSPDGKKLVFSSNRNNGGTRDTNVFIADWVEPQ